MSRARAASELNRVIGPQGYALGQAPGPCQQVGCDLYVVELAVERLQPVHSFSQLVRRDTSHPAGTCQTGTSLDIRDTGRRHPRRLAPHTVGQIGQRFIDQERDDRRRVEVGDHRRSSMIKGDTGPVAVMRLRSGVRSLSRGGVTTPSATSRSSRSGGSKGTISDIRPLLIMWLGLTSQL